VELEGGTGLTRDVSISGVFFETDRYLVLGEQVRLTLVLGRLSPDDPVRLQCDGRVVRVERREMQLRLGVAVAIESYRFMTREQLRRFA
jgi:Tfp pilus assembly protein PilZ